MNYGSNTKMNIFWETILSCLGALFIVALLYEFIVCRKVETIRTDLYLHLDNPWLSKHTGIQWSPWFSVSSDIMHSWSDVLGGQWEVLTSTRCVRKGCPCTPHKRADANNILCDCLVPPHPTTIGHHDPSTAHILHILLLLPHFRMSPCTHKYHGSLGNLIF